MFERYMNALNDAVSAEPDDQISMLTPTCSANHTVYLCDFHVGFSLSIHFCGCITARDFAFNSCKV